MSFFQLPSRSKCRYLWTKCDYAGIVQNYESNAFYRKLCVSGIRKLDLDSIYLSALLQLHREEDVLRHRSVIEKLRESEMLAYRLELNRFAIESMHIAPTKTMAKAYDAIKAMPRLLNIEEFWKDYHEVEKIAVVGNAPVSMLNGEEIDSADLVIRFNKFRIAGYEKYIGTKTDVWCHICDVRTDSELKELYSSVQNIILTDNPLTVPVGEQFLDDILNSNKTIYNIPQNAVERMSTMLGAISSSGARVLISLASSCSNLRNKTKIFGFSFLDRTKKIDNFDHYFEKIQKSEKTHNIQNEITTLRSFFPDLLP